MSAGDFMARRSCEAPSTSTKDAVDAPDVGPAATRADLVRRFEAALPCPAGAALQVDPNLAAFTRSHRCVSPDGVAHGPTLRYVNNGAGVLAFFDRGVVVGEVVTFAMDGAYSHAGRCAGGKPIGTWRGSHGAHV